MINFSFDKQSCIYASENKVTCSCHLLGITALLFIFIYISVFINQSFTYLELIKTCQWQVNSINVLLLFDRLQIRF